MNQPMIPGLASSSCGVTGHQSLAPAKHCRFRRAELFRLLILALLLVLGGFSVLADQTVYSDSLAGSGNVAGSAPTVAGTDGGTNYGSSVWISTTANKSTRGSPANGKESNFLPFTPQSGRVYLVSATIDATGWASTEWYTVGLVQSNAAWGGMGNISIGTLVRGTNTATTPHSATVTVALDTRGAGWSNTNSYAYVGWLTDQSATTGPKISNFSLVIQNPCTVTYVGNTNTGGIVPVDSNVYSSNATVAVLGNVGGLARTGYCFMGWNTAANGNGVFFSAAGSTFTISSNTTLYAQWVPLLTGSSNNNAYVVATNDLLQGTGLSSVSDALTVNVGENNATSHGTTASLNDGTFGAAGADQGLCISGGTVTYNLNTNLNPGGYTITNITTYSGWANPGRADQNYTVSFQRVGSGTFVDSTNVTYTSAGGSPCDTQVSLGFNETNVAAIRFDFSTPAQQNGGVGYKELDVFGYGAAPVKQFAEVVAGIRAVTTPMRGRTNLVLPLVPSGFSVAIKSSSNPSVVGANGIINPPTTNTVLQLVLTVTQLNNNQSADTGVIYLLIPASTGTTPWISYTDNFTMRRGLFISWGAPPDGQQNPVVFSNGSHSTTINQFALSANVPAVVNQLAGFGFEYIYLQDFHGYQTTLNPCAALDSWRGPGCTSTRDLVGELIAGLKARGIKVYLFTHPLDGYDGYTPAQQALVGWLDPSGNYQTWNNFINDVYAELTERYGDDIAGFGFDSDFGMSAGDTQTYQKLDLNRLRQTILSRRPLLSLGALAGPTGTAEMGIKEVYNPSWLDPWLFYSTNNYNVEVWPAYRHVPFVVQGYHWATVLPPAQGLAHLNGYQLFRYSVLQAAAGTEGPGMCWAVSPYTDGTWENGVAAAFTNLEAYVQPVAASLTNVLPSTSYPLVEGVLLSTLPNGIAATRSLDDSIEYLHVLNPPSGVLALPLPSDGKQFLSATLLANGAVVALVTNMTGISLTLTGTNAWSSSDTVIKLLVNPATIPQPSLAFHKHVFASSSYEIGQNYAKPSWGAIRLVNGNTVPVTATNGWSAGDYGFSTAAVSNNYYLSLSPTNRPEWITIDLETTNSVNSVRLTPRNDGTNVGVGYPVNFAISNSLDGVNWTLATNLTSQPMATTAQTFTFAAQSARYVQLYASQLRANSSGTYGLQLSELEVFGSSSPSGLSIRMIQNGVLIQWTSGVLQSAPSLNTSFNDVGGAVSPYTNKAALGQQFYRLRN